VVRRPTRSLNTSRDLRTALGRRKVKQGRRRWEEGEGGGGIFKEEVEEERRRWRKGGGEGTRWAVETSRLSTGQ